MSARLPPLPWSLPWRSLSGRLTRHAHHLNADGGKYVRGKYPWREPRPSIPVGKTYGFHTNTHSKSAPNVSLQWCSTRRSQGNHDRFILPPFYAQPQPKLTEKKQNDARLMLCHWCICGCPRLEAALRLLFLRRLPAPLGYRSSPCASGPQHQKPQGRLSRTLEKGFIISLFWQYHAGYWLLLTFGLLRQRHARRNHEDRNDFARNSSWLLAAPEDNLIRWTLQTSCHTFRRVA